MKKTLPIMVICFMFASVSGMSLAEVDMNETELKQTYNSNTDELPSFLSDLIGDQKINVNIDNSTKGFEMEGVKLNSTQENGFEQPTLEVWIDRDQIENLSNSENPVQELNSKLKNNEIRYETHGAVNTVKFFVAEKLLSLGSLF